MTDDKQIQEKVQRRGARSNQKLKILYLAKILLEIQMQSMTSHYRK